MPPENKTNDTIPKSTLLQAIAILITLGVLISGVALAISDRPTRPEVRQMIDDKVGYRLDQIDKRLEGIEMKLQ